MDKYFVAVRTVGRWPEVVEKITRAVQNLGLNKVIPFVRPEKKAGREFYVFLSVRGDCADTAVVRDVNRVLSAAGLRTPLFPLTSEDISNMASRAEFEIRAINTYRSRMRQERDLSDPFEVFNEKADSDSVGNITTESKYEWLLAWLSATGGGSRQLLAKACESLGLIRDTVTSQRIIRNFTLLGLIETSADGENWTICPPTLVRSATDATTYFLCGARIPALKDALAGRWENFEIVGQPSHNGPPCVRVNAGELAEGTEMDVDGVPVTIAGCATENLSRILPNITTWANELVEIKTVVTTNYSKEKWNGLAYVDFDDVLEVDGALVGESGLYRLTHNHDRRKLTLFLDCTRKKWLRGDWYGLQFLDRFNEGLPIEAVYDEENARLMVAKQSHPPFLHERALVLSSGLLPSYSADWLYYEGISENCVELLTERLNFNIERKHA